MTPSTALAVNPSIPKWRSPLPTAIVPITIPSGPRTIGATANDAKAITMLIALNQRLGLLRCTVTTFWNTLLWFAVLTWWKATHLDINYPIWHHCNSYYISDMKR